MILSVYFYVFAFLTFLREFGDGKEVVIRRKETGDYLQDSTQKECTQYGRLASWNAGPSNICMCKQKATFFSTNDGDVGCYTGMEENAGKKHPSVLTWFPSKIWPGFPGVLEELYGRERFSFSFQLIRN